MKKKFYNFGARKPILSIFEKFQLLSDKKDVSLCKILIKPLNLYFVCVEVL